MLCAASSNEEKELWMQVVKDAVNLIKATKLREEEENMSKDKVNTKSQN